MRRGGQVVGLKNRPYFASSLKFVSSAKQIADRDLVVSRLTRTFLRPSVASAVDADKIGAEESHKSLYEA